MLFIACASVSCASREIEPSDIAPVEKRFTISDAGSTSSSGMPSAVAEAEAAAQRRRCRAFSVVHEPRVLLVGLGRAGADGVLELRDRVRVPVVVLAVAPPRVEADHRQERVGGAGIRARVARERLLGELADADAADPRRRAGEVALDELRPEPDRLEDLRAAVRRDRRDPHLRHRLEQALRDALRRAVPRLVRRHLRREPAELDELAERLEHQIRIHRGGAVPDEHGDAVHAARLAGLDDDARLQARSLADEMVVHGPGRKQGGNRHTTRAGTSVGEDEDVRAGGERDIRLCTDSFDRALETVGAVGGRPRRVDRPRLEDLGARRAAAARARSSSRIGLSITSCRACSGVSASRLRSEPTLAPTLMTTASRIESIGGFVTCAKSCLKYE